MSSLTATPLPASSTFACANLTEAHPDSPVAQFSCAWPTPPQDSRRLRQAWQDTLQSSALLRGAAANGETPALRWTEGDWTAAGGAEVSERFARFVATTRQECAERGERGDIHVALLRLGARDVCVVATFHHTLLDARHFPQLASEVFANYAAAHPEEFAAAPISSAAPAVTPPRRSFAPSATLVSLFEAQVRKTPDRIALSGVGSTLTYRELDERAERLAVRLQSRGVGPDVRVGLFVERSPDLIVAILGILKAGGGYVPIDPAYPPERISFLLHDAALGVLVTQSGLESRLPPHHARLVRVDQNNHEEIWPAVVRVPATPESLAYIIYTSGSTGRPKGVEITHHNVVRLFQSAEEWYDFNAEDVWTLFHSCSFDFSVWEIWGALLYGGRLVIVPHGVSRSPSDFLELLARERVTVLNQTPSAFRQLQHAELDAPPAGGLALRYVIFGGEALDLRSLRPWFDRHGDQQPKLVNMYGITETTVHVTCRPLDRRDSEVGSSVIGDPLSDLQLLVLDTELRPVGVGEVGELFVGGAGLARGYLNRPELTAQRFIPSPFAPSQRLYRTGDLARRLENGDLEYLGRCDQQVKIRGHRIELGEIESALSHLDGVRAAVVAARATRDGEKRLVAYVVPDPQNRPAVSALRELMAQRLPDYMVPAAFVFLDRLPLTAHGKIDRAALPEPAAERPELATPYVAPRTPGERAIAAAWCEVLGLERVGLDDNFFELGGDSLALMTLTARLRERGYPQLGTTDLFQFPTVGALAAQLGRPAAVDTSSAFAAASAQS